MARDQAWYGTDIKRDSVEYAYEPQTPDAPDVPAGWWAWNGVACVGPCKTLELALARLEEKTLTFESAGMTLTPVED